MRVAKDRTTVIPDSGSDEKGLLRSEIGVDRGDAGECKGLVISFQLSLFRLWPNSYGAKEIEGGGNCIQYCDSFG